MRVAVFTGAGEKAFMAGVDLKTFDTDDTEADPDDPGRLPREALEAVYDCAVPVIAAVNGPALGAGLAYAAVCDLILAADHATFGTTEINVGLLGASAHLNLLLGRPMVRELFLTGVPAPAASCTGWARSTGSCRSPSWPTVGRASWRPRWRRRARWPCGWPSRRSTRPSSSR